MDEDNVILVDDLKGALISFLKESKSDATNNPYITENGFAFYNGYCQSKNTISLIKYEVHEELLNNYEDLINKYEKLKLDNLKLKSKLQKKNKKSFFSYLKFYK